MGAFDGIRIPYDKGYPTTGFNVPYDYFANQSSFSFFKGFGVDELRTLLAQAEAKDSDTVWVPQEHKDWGTKGLRTWYVRALIENHFGVDS